MITAGRLRHLEFVLAQQDREDRLDLHGGERGAHAAVPTCAERDPGPAVDEVLLAWLVVAVGYEVTGWGKSSAIRLEITGEAATMSPSRIRWPLPVGRTGRVCVIAIVGRQQNRAWRPPSMVWSAGYRVVGVAVVAVSSAGFGCGVKLNPSGSGTCRT